MSTVNAVDDRLAQLPVRPMVQPNRIKGGNYADDSNEACDVYLYLVCAYLVMASRGHEGNRSPARDRNEGRSRTSRQQEAQGQRVLRVGGGGARWESWAGFRLEKSDCTRPREGRDGVSEGVWRWRYLSAVMRAVRRV